MKVADVLGFAGTSLLGYRGRSAMILLAMTIGVGSVLLLTAIGEGARRFVTGEFASLGTNLLIVLPGRSETRGGPPPLLGETPRDLTLSDALALERSALIGQVAPISLGSAPVSLQEREREVVIIGTTEAFQHVRHLRLARGRFLPGGDPRRGSPVVVLGAKVKRELFGNRSALGGWIRIGDRRFRVIGMLASEGRSIGLDLQDIAIIPVASAQSLFDRPALFRILAEARSASSVPRAKERIREIIQQRHDGEDDVTVITQDAVIATFDKIFRTLTVALGGIAAVSLVVAGILIMNVMLVAVSQRTAEIGLLKALGSPAGTVLGLFLTEAALLSLVGAVVGLLAGFGATGIVIYLYPILPAAVPSWAAVGGFAIALITGLLSGVLPAMRAASMDPVAALARR